jgi:hypothetical protein
MLRTRRLLLTGITQRSGEMGRLEMTQEEAKVVPGPLGRCRHEMAKCNRW